MGKDRRVRGRVPCPPPSPPLSRRSESHPFTPGRYQNSSVGLVSRPSLGINQDDPKTDNGTRDRGRQIISGYVSVRPLRERVGRRKERNNKKKLYPGEKKKKKKKKS